jgi:type I restriction enzyme S subunit
VSFPRYPEYKESGLERLGLVPAHWGIYSLKRSVEGCVNGIWGDEADGENDLAVIRVADFQRSKLRVGTKKLTYRSITDKEKEARKLRFGDLLIEKSGGGDKTLVGCVVLFEHDFGAVSSNFVARMRPLSAFNSNFLCYAFDSLYKGRVNYPSIKQTTGIQNLDSESYLQERFCFPTLTEQTQIARFLDHETAKIDTLIHEQKRLIELLKEKRQAVISHAVTKGLDPDVPMKDSGVEWLGEVPAHWGTPKLSWRSNRIGDGLHSTPEYEDNTGYYFVNGNNLVDGSINLSSSAKEVSYEEFVKHQVELGPSSVFISINGTIGNVAIYEGEPIILGKSAAYINCDLELHRKFLLHYLKSGKVGRYFDLEMTGTTIFNLSLRSLRHLKVSLPPMVEQEEIVKYLDAECLRYDNEITVTESLKRLLIERRSTLISAAVTGKIDVRDWQPPTDESFFQEVARDERAATV